MARFIKSYWYEKQFMYHFNDGNYEKCVDLIAQNHSNINLYKAFQKVLEAYLFDHINLENKFEKLPKIKHDDIYIKNIENGIYFETEIEMGIESKIHECVINRHIIETNYSLFELAKLIIKCAKADINMLEFEKFVNEN